MKVFDTSTTGGFHRSSKALSKIANNVGSSTVAAKERGQKESVTQTVKTTALVISGKTESGNAAGEKGGLSGNTAKANPSGINIQSLSKNKIKYALDDNKKIVMQLVDPESNEIIRQIPLEEQARISKAIEKILEESSNKSRTTGDVGVDTVV